MNMMSQTNFYDKPPKFVTHRSPPKKAQNGDMDLSNSINSINNNSTMNSYNSVITPQYIQPNITNTTINNQNYQMIFPYQMPQTIYYQGIQNHTQTQTVTQTQIKNNQNVIHHNPIFKTQVFNNNIQNNPKKQINPNNIISISTLILENRKKQIQEHLNQKSLNKEKDPNEKKVIQFKIRKCRK